MASILVEVSTDMTKQNQANIGVLIVDDQKFVREMLKTYLAGDPAIEVLGVADTGHSAISQIETQKPDVAIMDIKMPGIDGLSAGQAITRRFPDTKILVLSSHDDFEHLNRALQIGAKGYLHKATPPSELIDAIHAIHKGYFQLGPGLLERILPKIVPQELNTPISAPAGTDDVGQHSDEIADRPANLDTPPLEGTGQFSSPLSREERLSLETQLANSLSRVKSLERTSLVLWLTVLLLGILVFFYVLFFL